MARSLGGQVDELVRVLRAFEPGEFSGADCARLVDEVRAGGEGVGRGADSGRGAGGGVQRAPQGRVRGSVRVAVAPHREHGS